MLFSDNFFPLGLWRRQVPSWNVHRASEPRYEQEHSSRCRRQSISSGSRWSDRPRKDACRAVLSRRRRRQKSKESRRKENLRYLARSHIDTILNFVFSGHVYTSAWWRCILRTRYCLRDDALVGFAGLHDPRHRSHCRQQPNRLHHRSEALKIFAVLHR